MAKSRPFLFRLNLILISIIVFCDFFQGTIKGHNGGDLLARSNYSYQKRQKELARKKKKELKRQNKINKKETQTQQEETLPENEGDIA